MAFSYQPFATTAIFLRLILISSTAEKTPATSGGLNLGIPGLKWGIASAAECVKVRLERTSFATLRPFG
jgi:hypothetical protein